MIIGVPKEIKLAEYRVGLTPAGVFELVRDGHEVCIESGAGSAAGFSDEAYSAAGGKILIDVDSVYEHSEMIVKVKEPQAVERARLRKGQVLFTYLHLAPDSEQVNDLLDSGATCIAYETVQKPGGELPLLSPMSEVAGRLSIQAAAWALERHNGGKGVLLAGVPGVSAAKVVIIGGGVVGANALQVAVGTGASVTVIDSNINTLRMLDHRYTGRISTLFSSQQHIAESIMGADVVIGAVLIPGARAPKLVSKEMVESMSPGSVLVDVAIDQGGCFETSKATTHMKPTYCVGDIVHYCVANMPGAVPKTSTMALTNATLPYIRRLAGLGVGEALRKDESLLKGLNIADGKLVNAEVAGAQNRVYHSAEDILSSL